jgi:hypothetical protein
MDNYYVLQIVMANSIMGFVLYYILSLAKKRLVNRRNEMVLEIKILQILCIFAAAFTCFVGVLSLVSHWPWFLTLFCFLAAIPMIGGWSHVYTFNGKAIKHYKYFRLADTYNIEDISRISLRLSYDHDKKLEIEFKDKKRLRFSDLYTSFHPFCDELWQKAPKGAVKIDRTK